jgi:flavin-dependent dehydrogenase
VERVSVLIVGGGPAGSACAAALVAAGFDVLVVDQERFPRDKPCAGWITPEVVERLRLPLAEYAREHTLQAIRGFRVGTICGRATHVDYGAPVSYGIRRCEFDAWLLRRSKARLALGERVTSIERIGSEWVVNGRFAAPLLVGAGGHFCPVARYLGGPPGSEALVVAREVEHRLEGEALAACRVDPSRPELYFSRDLMGYGWCFRKGAYLNVGLGRRDGHALPRQLETFLAWLVRERRILAPESGWRGHAYRLSEGGRRQVAADGILLAGDAAGLAFAASGEGILAAVVSGQLAAEAIVESGQAPAKGALASYERRLTEELGPPSRVRSQPGRLAAAAGAALLGWRWFARHVVLDRLFLHRAGARPAAGLRRAEPLTGAVIRKPPPAAAGSPRRRAAPRALRPPPS